MTRGPKPRKQPETIDVDVLPAEGAHGLAVMRQEAHAVRVLDEEVDSRVRALASEIGYLLPADCADPELIQRDIRANIQRSVEACLEVGRGLVVLKELCGHGHFMDRLDAMQLNPGVARKFMQAARKFPKRSSTSVLEVVGNQTKLFELMILDEDQLDELEEFGRTGSLVRDEIASMSVRQLRDKVRDLVAENTAKEELLAERSKQRDALQEKLIRAAQAKPDEKLAALRKEAESISLTVQAYIQGAMRQTIIALQEGKEQHGIDCDLFLAGLFGEMKVMLDKVRDEFFIPDAGPLGIPEWIREGAYKDGRENLDELNSMAQDASRN
ncbi:MAG: DUF3102 domain-containing protein [Proteobacteria bacterium]|nr:DUF3102 domain-containing protein [Pseudomonadota bacterium]